MAAREACDSNGCWRHSRVACNPKGYARNPSAGSARCLHCSGCAIRQESWDCVEIHVIDAQWSNSRRLDEGMRQTELQDAGPETNEDVASSGLSSLNEYRIPQRGARW